jgi:hypothetical protein
MPWRTRCIGTLLKQIGDPNGPYLEEEQLKASYTGGE